MYLDYYNTGNGFITVNETYPIKINISDNIESLDCDEDYTSEGDLSKSLTFIKNKALRTICNFKTKSASSPIDIRSLSITADYRYILDNSISVIVKPGTITSRPTPPPETCAGDCYPDSPSCGEYCSSLDPPMSSNCLPDYGECTEGSCCCLCYL